MIINLPVRSGGSGVADGKYIRTTRFATIVSGTSGTITIPANSTIVLNDFGGTVDAVVAQISGGKPTVLPVVDSTNTVVAATLDSSGNYTLVGTPSAYPIALIYRVTQTIANFDDTSSDIFGLPMVYSTRAEAIFYTPGTASFWPETAPSEVKKALDQLVYGRNDPLKSSIEWDNFVARVVASDYGWLSAANGTSAAVVANGTGLIAALSGKEFQGVITGNTGTTSTGRAALYRGINDGIFKFNSGTRVTQKWRVLLTALSDGTDSYHFSTGLHNTTTTKDTTTDGIYIQYDHTDSANWRLICASGGAFDRFTSTIPVVAGDFVEIGFEVNEAMNAVSIIINGVKETFSTTKIPTNYNNVLGLMCKINKTVGTTDRAFVADYYFQDSRKIA